MDNIYEPRIKGIKAVQFTRQNQQKCQDFTGNRIFDVTTPRCMDGVMTGNLKFKHYYMELIEGDYIVRIGDDLDVYGEDFFNEKFRKI